MKKIFTIIFATLLAVTPLFAQRTITGKVLSADGEPLIGALVFSKDNKSLGAATDINGMYMLSLPENIEYTLQASYIGYITKSKTMKPGHVGRVDFILSEDAYNLETVVVTGTRTPKLLKDVPIVTRVITAEDIKKADATHIGDLLQSELPGVEFSYSMNQQTALNLQGFGGNSVLFLVDGERIAGETLDNVDYSRLNLDNVERIEIVKGAASSLYGSNAVGGVVNIISREVEEPWTANVNARVGAHNEQRYGGSFGFKAGRFNSMTNIQHTTVDAINLDNEGDFGTVYGSRTWNVKERLVFKPAEGLKLTGRAGYFFRERDTQETAKERYRGFSGGLKGDYSLCKDGNLELSYGFDQYDKSDYSVASGNDVRDYSNVQNTLHALYSHSFGKNTLTVGGDYMRDYLMSYQFVGAGSHKQYTADAFAQFDWNITDHFNLLAALRYDHFSEAGVHNVSPKLSFMYKISNCSLRGSYAGGFRAPTLKEMYMNFDMANIFMIYGNPGLEAEKSHNFSLSAEYLRGNYNVTVTGFYNIVRNRITTAWNKALDGMRYVNMAPMRIAGAEVNASARFACGISARLSYAYTYEHIKKNEPLTSSTRPHTLTARVDYDKNWKNYGLNIALNGRYLSAVETDEYTSVTDLSQTEKAEYPDYSIWKLTLTQKILKGINVTTAVDNLFDYVPAYYYSNSPATTGRTFTLGVSVDIDRLF